MKMKLFLLLLLSFVISNTLFPNDINKSIDSANVLYKNAKFEDAANVYQSIINNGYVSSEIYYNTANSYFKSNKLILAILYFEKAKAISPNDEDIAFNLELANKYIVDKIDKIPEFFLTRWVNDFISLFSSDNWSIISLSCFIFFLLLLSIYLFSRTVIIKKLSFWISILLLFIAIISFICAKIQYSNVVLKKSGIIKTQSLNIKSSPDNNGTDIFILHEGTKVELRDSIGTWYEIKMSNGNIGWIEKSDIYII